MRAPGRAANGRTSRAIPSCPTIGRIKKDSALVRHDRIRAEGHVRHLRRKCPARPGLQERRSWSAQDVCNRRTHASPAAHRGVQRVQLGESVRQSPRRIRPISPDHDRPGFADHASSGEVVVLILRLEQRQANRAPRVSHASRSGDLRGPASECNLILRLEQRQANERRE